MIIIIVLIKIYSFKRICCQVIVKDDEPSVTEDELNVIIDTMELRGGITAR